MISPFAANELQARCPHAYLPSQALQQPTLMLHREPGGRKKANAKHKRRDRAKNRGAEGEEDAGGLVKSHEE